MEPKKTQIFYKEIKYVLMFKELPGVASSSTNVQKTKDSCFIHKYFSLVFFCVLNTDKNGMQQLFACKIGVLG